MQIAFKFCLLLLTVSILCQDQRQEKAFVKGRTFQGEITLSGNTLKIEIVQFSTRRIYLEEITNQLIEKESVRFMVFKNTEELLEEIKDNQKMQIVDGKLLIPLEVTYRRRRAELSLEITLTQRRFENEEERIQILLSIIETINNEKVRQHRELTPQKIDFKPDPTNKNIGMFELSEWGGRIKKIGPNAHLILNSAQVLPKRGIFYFQIKVIRTIQRAIFVGICGKHIKENIDAAAYHNPFFMGYFVQNGRMYGNHQDYVATAPPNILLDQTVIKLEIDMNRKWFTVYINKGLLYATEIKKELAEVEIYPIITLYTKDDIIEIVR